MAFAAPLIAAVPAFLGSSTGIAALGIASAGLTGLTAIQQGNYQNAVAKNNAMIAEQNANRLSEASQLEAQRSDIDYRALIAEQLAQQGASGFDVLGRSAIGARRTTARTGRRAARDIIHQGASDARNRLQEAANFRTEGKQAKLQGYMTGVGSLLQAGSLIKGRRRRSFEGRA